ncbi:hypothetical protein OA253_00695 [Alphaproteobacteria bacterium]|nr:hypothetical protein [Alphaproteobacteria bacterium]
MNEIFCSQIIKNSVEKILNHHDTCVFIFHGQEGNGKRSFTNFLANKILHSKNDNNYFKIDLQLKLNQLQKKNENLFLNKTHPDVFIIEEENNKSIKIDKVRELKQFLSQTPSVSEYKIIIIDPIEDLTINATNTLLKSLEETNHNTYIFLISHNLENVLQTIQSRVFKIYFNPISKKEFIYILKDKREFSFSNEELILVNNLFNFSPGKFLQFYPKENSLLSDYVQFIDNFVTTSYPAESKLGVINFDLNLKLLFLNNFIKNILTYFLEKKFSNFTINFEKEIIKNLNLNSVLVDKIYNEYNLFQSLLRDALIYNSNIDDLIEIFLKKIDL